jgi:lecithin:retinol acyltransferase
MTLPSKLQPIDTAWPAFPDQPLPLGAHVITLRRRYTHHGIHVGQGRIVQYAGYMHGLRSGPVEEISLATFTRGHPLLIRSRGPARFDAEEVVRRARSRMGENDYNLLTNNCEHFCEWCVYAEHRSEQVDRWLAPLRHALQVPRSLWPATAPD